MSEENKAKLTCPNCGSSNDAVIRYEHVGGYEDYQPIVQCRDQVQCWKRWDKQHKTQ